MIILRNLYKFDVPVAELIQIYILYIRSVVEQSAVLWHNSITAGEQNDIERVQKVALKIILKDNYVGYEEALKETCLESLHDRRRKLCQGFARKCVKSEKMAHMFPLNENSANTRRPEKYHVTSATTDRLANSAIPYMQRLLNQSKRK